MTNTVTVLNQPSTTHAVTVKLFTLGTFKEKLTTQGADGSVRTDFVFNSGVFGIDTVCTVSVGRNKDGSIHNTVAITSGRVVTDDNDVILESKPIKVGMYWDLSGVYEDSQSTMDLLGSLFGVVGLVTADGAPNLGLINAVTRELTRAALG